MQLQLQVQGYRVFSCHGAYLLVAYLALIECVSKPSHCFACKHKGMTIIIDSCNGKTYDYGATMLQDQPGISGTGGQVSWSLCFERARHNAPFQKNKQPASR